RPAPLAVPGMIRERDGVEGPGLDAKPLQWKHRGGVADMPVGDARLHRKHGRHQPRRSRLSNTFLRLRNTMMPDVANSATPATCTLPPFAAAATNKPAKPSTRNTAVTSTRLRMSSTGRKCGQSVGAPSNRRFKRKKASPIAVRLRISPVGESPGAPPRLAA